MSAPLRCVVLDDYQNVARASGPWERLDDRIALTILHEHIRDEDALVAAIGAADILVVMRERTPVTARLLGRLPALRLLITTGLRNASIDLAAAQARGIVVCGTKGLATATAELTWALILSLARHLTVEVGALRSGGPWQQTLGVDLAGKTLGLIGLGSLGGQVARIGAAFGMRPLAWSANLTDARCAEIGAARADSLLALMREADFASIHLVLSDRSRGLVGREAIAAMKPTAFLVNTSRAPIVDRDALFEALREGRIAGAASDVHDEEPLPADDEARRLPNLLATPHLGYVTETTYRNFFDGVVEDIAAWLDGRPVRVLGG